MPLAAELDRLNRERRDVESTMQEEALAALEARAIDGAEADAYTLCLFHPDWHQGVVGIVAGRLKDRYHRPSIVFARGTGGELKGSGRSIAGFHLRDALDLAAKRAPGLLTKFGGHAFAAGLTLAESDLPRFAAIFEAIAREQLSPADLARTLDSDGSLASGELGRRARARPARRGLGPGLSRPGVRRHVFRAGAAHRRREPFEARARPRHGALRRDPLSSRGSAPPLHPRGLSTGRERVARRSIAAAGDRALAARLTPERVAVRKRGNLPQTQHG